MRQRPKWKPKLDPLWLYLLKSPLVNPLLLWCKCTQGNQQRLPPFFWRSFATTSTKDELIGVVYCIMTPHHRGVVCYICCKWRNSPRRLSAVSVHSILPPPWRCDWYSVQTQVKTQVVLLRQIFYNTHKRPHKCARTLLKMCDSHFAAFPPVRH